MVPAEEPQQGKTQHVKCPTFQKGGVVAITDNMGSLQLKISKIIVLVVKPVKLRTCSFQAFSFLP